MIIKAFQTRLLLAFLLCSVSLGVYGIPSQDNINGIWQDTYVDSVGIVPPATNVTVSDGVATLTDCAVPGEYLSLIIQPSGLSGWTELTLDGIISSSTVTVEVYQDDDAVGFSGTPLVSDNSFPLDLSAIDAGVNPSLEVRVIFTPGPICPAISQMNVSWAPQATFLLDKRAPTSAGPGSQFTYTLRASVSNTNANNVVLWDTLPSKSAGTVTQVFDYGQDDSPSFVSANQGGLYTATAIMIDTDGDMVDDFPIPANSVYWNLGTLAAGVSKTYQYNVQVPSGTIDATEYLNTYTAEASNAVTKVSNEVTTTITNTAPLYTRKSCSGRVISSENHCQIAPNETVTFNVSASKIPNHPNTEPFFDLEFWDDLSSICATLAAATPPVADCSTALSAISGGGVYDAAFDHDNDGGTATIPAIVWPTITGPTSGTSQSYDVDFNGVAESTSFSNTVCADSARGDLNCDDISLSILNQSPSGGGGKSATREATWGLNQNVGYGLGYSNSGLVELNDIILFDRIPDEVKFASLSVSAAANATVFYSTDPSFTDPNTPPTYDLGDVLDTIDPTDIDVGGNTFWDTAVPADPSTVTWVAVFVPRLSSPLAIAPLPAPTSVSVGISGAIKDADACSALTISNAALSQLNASTDLSLTRGATGNALIGNGSGSTTVIPYVPELKITGSVSPNPLQFPGTQTFTLNIENRGDTAQTLDAVVSWGQVQSNGVSIYPGLVSASGGDLDLTNAGSGQISFSNMGPLPAGQTTSVQVALQVPDGLINGSTYSVSLSATATDDLCGSTGASGGVTATLGGSGFVGDLDVFKTVSPALLGPGEPLSYEFTYSNIGPTVSTGTYVVDALPNKAVLLDVELPNGEALYCSGPPLDASLPSGLSPASPIDASIIASSFTLGTDTGGGVWTCPFGEATTWIAALVDDTSLSPSQLGVVGARNFTANMRNDEDPEAPQVDSPNGTVWFNAPAIFSNELLQAIGNSTINVITDLAALKVDKSGPGVVGADEEFIWQIDFENNSTANIPLAVITDALPAGTSLVSASLSWNQSALDNGAVDVADMEMSGYIAGDDFLIAPGARSGDLLGREGGTIELTVRTDTGLPSGSLFLNTACASGEDSGGDSVPQVCDSDIIEVQNPELELNKLGSPPDPRAGDTISYSLLIKNHNLVSAPDITITDVLPAELTYVPGSARVISPLFYSIGEPAIAGQLLTWDAASGNALTDTTTGLDQILAGDVFTGNIVIEYQVTVNAGISPGAVMINQATISTSLAEDAVYADPADCGGTANPNGFQNTDCVLGVATPLPDPSLSKDGDTSGEPGTDVTHVITYRNENNEDALDVYVIDSLPDVDSGSGGDADADVTYLNDTPPAGVTPYYSAIAGAAPAFDPADPLTSGDWTATTGGTVNHIAWVVGTLGAEAGPFTISVTVRLRDQSDNSLVGAGQSFINTATIFTSSPEASTANNTDTHETVTPGVDMQITKVGSVEGAVPGILPGADLDYTITYTNSGTVTAYGVHIEDTLPTGLTLTNDSFTSMVLVDADGNNCSPVDLGGIPITATLPVVRVDAGNVLEWFLGGASPAHQAVGIPVGCSQSFTLSVKLDTDLSEFTVLENQVRLTTDDTGPVSVPDTVPFDCNELYCDNNQDLSSVTVLLPDLLTVKSVVDEPTGSEELTTQGNILTYTIEYDNIGTIAAENVEINEVIPAGTTYVPGSLTVPDGASSTFSPAEDASATDFSVNFGSLPAPANFTGESLMCSDLPEATSIGDVTGGDPEDGLDLNNGAGVIYAVDFFGSGPVVQGVDFQTNAEAAANVTISSTGTLNSTGCGGTDLGASAEDNAIEAMIGNINWNSHPEVLSVNMAVTPGTKYTVDILLPTGVCGNRNQDILFEGATIADNLALSPTVSRIVSHTFTAPDDTATIQLGGTALVGGNPIGPDNNATIAGIVLREANGCTLTSDVGPLATASTTDSNVEAGHLTGEFTTITTIDNLNGGDPEDGLDLNGGAGVVYAVDFNGSGPVVQGVDFQTNAEAAGTVSISSSGSLRIANCTVDIGTSAEDSAMEAVLMPINWNPAPDVLSVDIAVTPGATYHLSLLFNNGSCKAEGRTQDILFEGGTVLADNLYLTATQPRVLTHSFVAGDDTATVRLGPSSLVGGNAVGGDNNAIISGIVLREAEPLTFAYDSSGSLEYTITPDSALNAWNALTVDDEVPDDTTLLYTLGRQSPLGTCVYDLGAAYTDIDMVANSGYYDISGIDTANTDLCLTIDFATNDTSITPQLNAWQVSYRTDERPSFTFQVQVDDPYQGTEFINNNVVISSTTPDSDESNNADDDSIRVAFADLEVVKAVDQTVVSVGSVSPGPATLTYAIDYINNGPDTAANWSLSDSLPSQLLAPTSITPSLTSNANTLSCAYVVGTHSVDCVGLSSADLAIGESGSITITANINSGTPVNALLTNNVTVATDTAETDTTNNDDSASTLIGSAANVYITKDGPASATLGGQIVYTLAYGNDGNLTAVDVVVADALPAGCSYDAAAQGLTSPLPNSVAGQNLTWSTLGATGGTLIAGETGSITVACTVTDPLLVGTTITNNVVITTTTPELTESDNQDDHDTIITVDLATLAGVVFHDADQNNAREVSETPIAGVTITLTGTDIFGDPVLLTTTTDTFGAYSFVGLNPSDASGYTVTETQPTSWESTASVVGTVDAVVTGSGGTTDPSFNQITGIVLGGGDLGINYDFGEFVPMEMSKTAGMVTDNGAGVFTATYTVTATNTANAPTLYSYTDLPTAPAGTTLTSVTLAASAASAADITTTPSNGVTSASVTDEPIVALGIETWDVTVVFTLTDAIALAGAALCTDQATAEGGFANEILSSTDTDTTNNDACLPLPIGVIDLSKSVTDGASNNFDGTYTVEYTITATNTGTFAGSYDVVEDFRPGVGITLNTASVAYGGEMDGTDGTITTPLTGDSTAVSNESLAVGQSETWVISALFDVDTAIVTAAGIDCDASNDMGTETGFANNVTGSSTDPDLTNNDTCTELEVDSSSLGDRVWLDENGDGVQDPGEDGIANVTVTLTHSDPTIDLGAGPGVAITRVTDSNGEYLFTELPPGDYTVTVVDTTLASGLAANPTYDEDDGVVGPGGVPSTIHTTVVNLDAGEDHRTADFGYNWSSPGDTDNPDPGALAALGDRIWLDVDGDGAQDAGEVGIAGVTVNLLNEAGAVIATTTTDADGRYIFDDLAAGAYQVEVDDSTLPAGLVQTGDPDDFGIAATNPDHLTTTPIVLAPGDVFVNADFGYQPGNGGTDGSDIGDTIYIDSDGDGVEDAGEPGIAGVTVSLLDGAGNVIATTITDARGSYLFESLPAGDYQVVVTDIDNVLSGLSVTGNPIDDVGALDNEGSVIILDGINDNLDQDFGYVPEGHTAGDGLIGDTIYLDINSDGIEDATDPGIQGVTVRLYDAGGALLDSVQTDANGQYLFGGLDPTATYTVTVDAMTLPTGLYSTADPDDDGIPANGDEDNTSRVDLSLTGGVNLEQDYGYSANNPVTPDDESNSLSGTLWEDLNADGTLTAADEAGRFTGVTIDVYGDPDGDMVFDTLIATTTTDANGDYSVTGLPDGVYEVKVSDKDNVLAGNWHSDGVNDGIDNNSQVNGYRVDLDAANASAIGVTDTTSDFGFYNKAGALGNTVWRDLDGDGLFDPATEPGIEGVEVTLLITYPNGDTATLTTTTDLAGHYEFGNLLLDEDGNGTLGSPTYSVSVDMASANNVLLLSQLSSIYVDGTSDSSTVGGAPSDDEDLDVGGDDPSAEPGFPIQGGVDATNDFGFMPTGSIGNRVWQDGDSDGIQDATEEGIGGVTVTLRVDTDNDGIPDTDVESQVTGPDGEYLFTDVVPGIAYEVVLDDSTLPPGVVQTFDEDDGATTTPATPHASGPIIVSPGEEHLTADFGYQIAPGSIGDTVWVDADGDGIQDPGENGIAGIPVYLQGDTDGDGLPDTVLSTTTDANGKYIFTGLTEGTYVVVVNPSDTTNPVGSGVAPTGYTAHDAGDPDVRFGFSPTADNETTVVLTNEGGTVTSYVDADFGYLPPDDQNNTVGDFVWLDSNGDGVQDAGEAGIAGVTVALIDQATGTVVASTVTDANGGYLFTGVPDGLYEVEVTDTNAVLGGLQQTYDEDDGASLTPTTPNRTVVDVDSGSTNALPEVIDTADFGYFNPTNPTYTGVIGDTVFFDVDGNGVQDASENGLEGVWVGLYTPGPDGVFGSSDDVLVGVENTNENGQYSFSGLPTSDTGEDYQVRVDPTSLPNSGAGWVNSADPDAVLDGVSEVTLTTASPIDLDQDFGYQGDVGGNNAIEGTLWVDNDGDGMLIESGRFENVSIELLDTNGNIVATTLTDVNGNYRFEGLPDGIYTVVVTDVNNVLAGYQHTDGPTPGSDLNSQNDQGYTVDLDSANAIAEAVLDVTSDFGYEPAVSNPITMGTFTSEVDGGRIWIRWSTQVEVGNVGFHLYGKVSNETDWVRLNEDLIIGAGDSIAEHQYEFLVYNESYNEGYKAFLLSDVDIYGKEQLHGPYRVNRSYGVKSSRKATDWQAIKQGKAEKRKAKRLRKQRKLQRKLNRLRQQSVSQSSSRSDESHSYAALSNTLQSDSQASWLGQATDAVLSALLPSAHASQPDSPERIESLERTESDQQQAALKARTKKVKAKQERKRRVKQKLDRLRQQPVSQQQTSEKRPWFELAASVLLAAFISDAEAQTASSDTSLVNLLVNESRVYALSHADLMAKGINLAGIPLAELALIDDHGAYTPLELDGSQADETVFGAGATLRFIGDGQETLYSDQRAYTLVRTSDLSSARVLDDPSDLPQAATSLAYRAQVSHAPQTKYSYNAPGDDPWYAERLLSVNENGDETSIQLPVDYVVTGSSIRPVLSVSVWGATDLPGATADHHVQVLLNGSVVKERRFDGIRAETLAAKASSLSNGNNQVVVRLPHEHGFVVDQVNLESVTLSYPRAYVSDGSSLRFSSSDARFSVRKLNSKNTAVYRRDRNGEVHRLSKAVQSGICDTGQADCVVSFAGYQERSEYFVETLTDLAKPEVALIADTSGLFTGAAEYVIIAHGDFIDVDSQPLQALIEELNGEFNGAALVDVEAVMAAYGHVADADAIKQYIKQISKPTSANGRGTRYVLLVGADMFDYHHYLNDTGVSFIPTLYRQTDPVIRHAPVDSLFADIDGDQVQDIAIGRLPVRTEAELLNVMNKRSQYLQRSYKKKAVFLADQEDIVENYDFGKDADSASAAYFSDWQVTQAQSDDLGNSQARTTFIQAINQGQSLASYYGHSSTAQWSFNGLFTGDDVTLLNNQNRPTVVTQWGCWNTYYVSPTEDSMAVRLLLEDNKGAVSVMGASTFTEAHAEKALSELVYQQLAAGARLGDAMVEAKQQFAEDYPYQLDVLLGWTLLGFPELRIH